MIQNNNRVPFPETPALPQHYICTTIHTIQAGDTLYALSHKYNVTVSALMQANNIDNPYSLQIGQQICIPRQDVVSNNIECDGIMHTIVKGDTPYLLAKHYGVTLNSVLEANPKIDPHNLMIGSQLCIPGVEPAAPEPSIPQAPFPMPPRLPIEIPSQPAIPVEPVPIEPIPIQPRSMTPMPEAPMPAPVQPGPRTPMPEAPMPTPVQPGARTPMPEVPMPTPVQPRPRTPMPEVPMPAPVQPGPRTPMPEVPMPAPVQPRPRAPMPEVPMPVPVQPGLRTPMPEVPMPAPVQPGPRAPMPEVPMPAPVQPGQGRAASTKSEYTVNEGDTLYMIAKNNGITLDELINANPDLDFYNLKVGMILFLPGKAPKANPADDKFYSVQPGDNLDRICNHLKVLPRNLMKANPQLTIIDYSMPGTKICIPG